MTFMLCAGDTMLSTQTTSQGEGGRKGIRDAKW